MQRSTPSPATPASEAQRAPSPPVDAPPVTPPPADAPRGRRAAACGLFAALFAGYLATFAPASDGQILGNDAIPYARALAAGDAAGSWNPHHLLFHPLAALVLRVLAALGLGGEGLGPALLAQQVVSAAGGAAAATALFLFAARRTSLAAALALAGLFGVAAGNWLYAAVGETYLPATAASLALLARAAEARLGERPERRLALGGLLLLAVLLRQDSVVVVAALPLLLSWRGFAAVVGGAGAVALALYAAAWTATAPDTAFGPWLRGLAATGEWGRAPDAEAWRVATGLVGAALNYGVVELAGRRAGSGADAVLGLASWSLLAAALLPLRRPRAGARVVGHALVLTALVRHAFFTWWQPGNLEYHAGTLAPLFLLAALSLHRPIPRPALACLVAALALTAGTNWHAVFRANRGDLIDERARAVLDEADGGLVLSMDLLQLYAVWRAQAAGGGGADVVDASTLTRAPDPAELAEWKRRVDARLERGQRVVLTREIALPARFPWPAPPIPEDVVAALLAGRTPRLSTDATGAAWAVVLEP